jgi:kelch-like protein 26
MGDRLYVCGGWFEDADTGNRILMDTVDVYDVAADRWQIVTRVPTPRNHAGIVGVDTKIYFIGGFHSDAMFDRATGMLILFSLFCSFVALINLTLSVSILAQ